MNSDLLWHIFEVSSGYHWVKLCLLDVVIWKDELFQKWKKVFMSPYQYYYFDKIVEHFSDSELILWLQDEHLNLHVILPLYGKYGENEGIWYYAKHESGFTCIVCTELIRAKRLAMLKWFVNYRNLKKDYIMKRYGIFNGALLSSDIELIRWLIDKFNITKHDIPYSLNNDTPFVPERQHSEELQQIMDYFDG